MKIKQFSFLDTKSIEHTEIYRCVNSFFYACSYYIPYNIAYFGNDYIDKSLIVYKNEEPVLIAYLTLRNNILSFFNYPILIGHLSDLDNKTINDAYSLLFNELDKLKAERLLFHASNPFLNAKFYTKIGKIVVNRFAYIDLKQDTLEIKRNIRKSYRSLINWGYKNLNLKKISNLNITPAIFNDVKIFHIEVAGKKTRSEESWDIQFNLVKQGHAFLLLAYLDTLLVGTNIVFNSKSTSYYGVGIYNRNLMKEKKPISHVVILESILYAKELGFDVFELGDVSLNDTSEKEKQIAYFKAGFTNTISYSIT